MKTKPAPDEARRFALIALAVLGIAEIVSICLWRLDLRLALLGTTFPANAIATFIFSWVVPPIIAYKVEKRGRRSLGITIKRGRYLPYAVYALVGLVLPALLVEIDRTLWIEFLEQIVYIGLAEELFSRGYLMTRLCHWLGNRWGLLLSSLIFGLAHIISRISQHGLAYPIAALQAGGQGLLGGLLLGYIYLKAESIVPGAIFHVSLNAYLDRIIEGIGNFLVGIS